MGYYPPFVQFRENVMGRSSPAASYVEQVKPIQRSLLNRLSPSLKEQKMRLKQEQRLRKGNKQSSKMAEYSFLHKRGVPHTLTQTKGKHIDDLI